MLNRNSNQLIIITRYAAMFLVTLFIVYLASCAQEEKKEPPKPKARPTGTGQPEKAAPTVDIHNVIAVIETAKGTMEVEFYPDDAPQTVTNFVKNARLEFYNDESFYRVEPGLIIQAGSRLVGGTIPIEQNRHEPLRGALIMAKEPGATVSDAAAFFICLDKLELDGEYTVFGRVTRGIDVIDKIAQGDKIVKISIRNKG